MTSAPPTPIRLCIVGLSLWLLWAFSPRRRWTLEDTVFYRHRSDDDPGSAPHGWTYEHLGCSLSIHEPARTIIAVMAYPVGHPS